MSVTVTDPVSPGYAPNSLTTAFAFAFKAASTAEVEVVQVLDGVASIIDPSDYTITIDSDGEGGTVTFGVAPATGSGTLYIVSAPLFTQTMTLANGGPFTPSVLNPAFDRAAIRDVFLNYLLGRAIKVQVGEDAPPYPVITSRASRYLAHDDAGNPVPGITTEQMNNLLSSTEGAINPNYTYAINTLAAGASATIGATGTYPDITLTFGIPRGAQGASGALSDGDFGDIVVSGTGTVLTVDAKAITYSKIQDVAANSVLARAAGTSGVVSAVALAASQLLGRGSTGNVAAIALGSGLEMDGATLNLTSAADPWTYDKLTADFAGTSITLESCGLSASGLEADSYYEFEATLTAYAASGSFNIGLAWPANVTGSATIRAVNGSSVISIGGNQSAAISTQSINTSNPIPVRITGHFYSGATAPTGSLDVQIKGNSVASTHTVQRGSFLRLRKI